MERPTLPTNPKMREAGARIIQMSACNDASQVADRVFAAMWNAAFEDDWQDRVIKEKAELDTKLVALSAFISRCDPRFEALPEEDKAILREQRGIMLEYSNVLESRILRFG